MPRSCLCNFIYTSAIHNSANKTHHPATSYPHQCACYRNEKFLVHFSHCLCHIMGTQDCPPIQLFSIRSKNVCFAHHFWASISAGVLETSLSLLVGPVSEASVFNLQRKEHIHVHKAEFDLASALNGTDWYSVSCNLKISDRNLDFWCQKQILLSTLGFVPLTKKQKIHKFFLFIQD